MQATIRLLLIVCAMAGVIAGCHRDADPVTQHVVRAAPERPAQRSAESRASTSPRRVAQGETGDLGFDAFIRQAGEDPPDPYLAVGPDHVVAIINHRVRVFRKTDGALLRQQTLHQLWGDAHQPCTLLDPRVLYDDDDGGHFFATASASFCTCNEPPPGCDRCGYLMLVVSETADALGPWRPYALDMCAFTSSSGLWDQPRIGLDDQYVYINANAGSQLSIFDKTALISGQGDPLVFSGLTGASPPNVSPTDRIPPDGTTRTVFVRATAAFDHLRLTSIRGFVPFTLATTTIDVEPFDRPPNELPQRGAAPGFYGLSTDSSLAYDATTDALWVAHTVQTGDDRVVVRWYEIALRGWPGGPRPELAQWGQIDPPPTEGNAAATFMPAIAVDDHGHTAIVYELTSDDEYISLWTAFRYATDPPGTFDRRVRHLVSGGARQSGRWGDYASIDADPDGGRSFLAHHQYVFDPESETWRTWIQSVTPYCEPDVDFDGRVAFGDLLAVLSGWGPCPPEAPCPADIDGDGAVTFGDLLRVLAGFGCEWPECCGGSGGQMSPLRNLDHDGRASWSLDRGTDVGDEIRGRHDRARR